MSQLQRHDTVAVRVGAIQVGGGAPVVVQSMTNTDTADIEATAAQIVELGAAGSELTRITVNNTAAARAVPAIVARVRDAGCDSPIIGDFHYNGHTLLREFPDCARALDKYRINPGNVGSGKSHDSNFAAICAPAVEYGKPVRIGVNAGSLNQQRVMDKMRQNTDKSRGLSPEEILNECMVESALESTDMALRNGLRKDQIIISAKSSVPRHLVGLYRELARRTQQPLHLGLTEAGMGIKGVVWSAAPLAILLSEGIGDTIRVSLTPAPGGDRCDEVYAACELLQSLGLRSFSPSITACPGCGRTTSSVFQELAVQVQQYVRSRMPEWRKSHEGVEDLTLAVMGCVVNGPGESKAANIGISLPGAGESPKCPVYIDGRLTTTLKGTPDQLFEQFRNLIDEYVENRYARRAETISPASAK